MGIPIIFPILFAFLLAIVVVVALINAIRKKSKWGIVIYALLVLLLVRILGMNYIDQWTISKKDIVSDFRYLNVALKDNFEIVENEVIGMPDRIQETQIEISQTDKARIIAEIENAANFKSFADGQNIVRDSYSLQQEEENNELFNFQYPDFYSREADTPINGISTRLILSVYRNTNVVRYQRID